MSTNEQKETRETRKGKITPPLGYPIYPPGYLGRLVRVQVRQRREGLVRGTRAKRAQRGTRGVVMFNFHKNG